MRARAPGPAVTTGVLQGGTWAGLASETPGVIPPLDLAYLAATGGCGPGAQWQARRAPSLSGAFKFVRSPLRQPY
jgi:hypothetical protein